MVLSRSEEEYSLSVCVVQRARTCAATTSSARAREWLVQRARPTAIVPLALPFFIIFFFFFLFFPFFAVPFFVAAGKPWRKTCFS